MSKLRHTFKYMPSPRNNNFKEGGIINTILKGAGNVIKRGGELITDAVTWIDDNVFDVKGLVSAYMTLQQQGASEDELAAILQQANLAQILGKQSDTKGIDFSKNIPDMDEIGMGDQGFVSSIKAVGATDVKPVSTERFVGETMLGANDVDFQKIAESNMLTKDMVFTQAQGPKGPNIKLEDIG